MQCTMLVNLFTSELDIDKSNVFSVTSGKRSLDWPIDTPEVKGDHTACATAQDNWATKECYARV
jgi:hypothetical protein